MSMLASDVANPEFTNPTNPDSALFVEFYMHEPIDKWTSDQRSYAEGRKIVVRLSGRPVIRIMKPGDNTSIIETEVREEHKRRWPQQWLYFQMNEGMLEENVVGWKIEDWDHLKDTPELLRDLKYARFYTVEQIAGANDAQVQALGMIGNGIREEARKAMRDKQSAAVKAMESAKDEEIADLRISQSRLEKQIQQLSAATGTKLSKEKKGKVVKQKIAENTGT